MSTSRLVVVDDSDTAIKYSSGWAALNGSVPPDILLDNAVFQTGHVLSSNGSLSYAFNGTSIEVFGVSSKLHLPSSHSQDPSWQCFIDNILISNNATALRGFPWTSYCSHDDLSDSPHNFTMNIAAGNDTKQFWLDYIRYTPLSADPLTDSTVLVNSTDSALQFSSSTDWINFGTAKITSPTLATEASLQLTFNGTGITWYSLSPNSTLVFGDIFQGSRSITEGSALATLDGVSQNWSIPSLVVPKSSDPSYDSVFLNYTSLDPTKEHILTVAYQGSLESPPLSLDFLLIKNGPLSAIGNSSTGAAQPPSGSPIEGTKHSSLNVAAVVGGVLGGVLALLILFLLIRYRRTRQTRARYQSKLNATNNNMVFHPDADNTFHDTDTFAMQESTLRNSDSMRAFNSPPTRKRDTLSKPLEEMPILEESAFPQKSTSSPPVPAHSETFPSRTHQPAASTSTSMPPSTRTSGMLIDFPEPHWSALSPTASPSNPFRRLTMASTNTTIPSSGVIASFENPSRETLTPPRSVSRSRSSTNPFRGGPLTSMSTGRS